MIKNYLKKSLCIFTSLAMLAGTLPVSAASLKTVSQQSGVSQVTTVKKDAASSETETAKADYAEGQALIMYSTSGTKGLTTFAEDDDIEVAETYDFDVPAEKDAITTMSTAGSFSISLVKSDKYTTEELIRMYKQKDNVLYAEPNYKLHITGTDPYETYQWALNNEGQFGGTENLDINADSELLKTSADDKEKVIALVDTGMDYTHEELKDVIWVNPYGEDYKGLRGLHGYDFSNSDTDPMDDNGHGTHCSGIMAAQAGNGTGISGETNNANIKIMALKILDASGTCYMNEPIGAYNYIYKAQSLGINIVSINNSWGGSDEGEQSEILKALIDLVGENGALSICAASNSGADNDECYVMPANIDSPYIVSVAATNENDTLAYFSDYGLDTVDIAAPGTDILSTVSYNCFQPVLYDDPASYCQFYADFKTGKPVITTLNGKATGSTAGTQDLSLMLETSDEAAGVNEVSYTNEMSFDADQTTGTSMKWTIKGAKYGDNYKLLIPYTTEDSSTPVYFHCDVTSMGSGSGETTCSEVLVSESKLVKNTYSMDEETLINGVDSGKVFTNWASCNEELTALSSREGTRVICISLYAFDDGDFTVYIDNLAISKNNLDSSVFGKYDFYNGTSMATPYVTAAAAVLSDIYPEEAVLDRKARLLGCTRHSDALEGMIKTAGVLDLSYAANPNMNVDTCIREDQTIKVTGNYLDGAVVTINGDTVTPVSADASEMTIDISAYENHYVNLVITKGEAVYKKSLFNSVGEPYNQLGYTTSNFTGGNLVSDGNELYYINDDGNVFIGTISDTPIVEEEPFPDENLDIFAEDESITTVPDNYITWTDMGTSLPLTVFGEYYQYMDSYSIAMDGNIAVCGRNLYRIVSLDVGFAAETILVKYNKVDNTWTKVLDIPDEISDLEGVTLVAFNGKLYFIGGYNYAADEFSDKVRVLDPVALEWSEGPSLPEVRAYAEAASTGKELIVTLGSNGSDTDLKNLIFDGTSWRVSEAVLTGVNSMDYAKNDGTIFPCYAGDVNAFAGGLIYTDLDCDGLGDTYIYDVDEDTYKTSGYCLNTDSLDADFTDAVTVHGKYVVMYADYYYPEDDIIWDWDVTGKTSSSDTVSPYYTAIVDEGGIGFLSFDIETDDVNYTEVGMDENGGYISGTGYYLAGDTVSLTGQAGSEDNYMISMTVDGQEITPDEDGNYIYTATASSGDADHEASITTGAYVSVIEFINNDIMLEKPAVSQNNVTYSIPDIYPYSANDQTLIWTSSDPEAVQVDDSGIITVTKNATVGETVTITVTAADRGTVSTNILVTVLEPSVQKGSVVTKSGIRYQITKAGTKTKTVTAIGLTAKGSKKSSLVIPDTVTICGQKFKVTAIADKAFASSANLTKVTIGKYVSTIGKKAFYKCSKLKKAVIKRKNVKIGSYAFSKCSGSLKISKAK